MQYDRIIGRYEVCNFFFYCYCAMSLTDNRGHFYKTT